MSKKITIALPKGRILKESLPLLKKAKIEPIEDVLDGDNRKLIVNSVNENIQYLILRSTDVLTYVSYGAAQIGFVGRDVLLEQDNFDVIHKLDLKIANCRLVLAAANDFNYKEAIKKGVHLTVATKYPNLTKKYFAQTGIQVEIIHLYGSMELAPIVGLADVIVDLVSTGNTLKANNLQEIEDIKSISTFLVVNKESSWVRAKEIEEIIQEINMNIS